MNSLLRTTLLLSVCLTVHFQLVAQNRASLEVDLGGPTRTFSQSVDSLDVDLIVRGIAAGTSPNVTIKETIGSSLRTETLPTNLFGQLEPFPTGSNTQAVRISLTKDGYAVGSIKSPFSSIDATDVLQKRTWRFPVEVRIVSGGNTFTVTLYKAFSFTGSILLDAARIDSLRTAKDPSVYAMLRHYDPKIPANAATKAQIKAHFEQTEVITLTSSRTDAAGNPTTIADTVKHNLYLAKLMDGLIADPAFPDPTPTQTQNFLVNGDGTTGSTRSAAAGPLGALSNPLLAADALATFIARRFKQEINVAFLNEFRTKLKIDTTLGVVFPRTKEIMLAVDPYQYTTFLESMKTAFEEDIRQLPINSAILLDSLVAQKKIRFSTDRVVLSKIALHTLQRTLDNRNDYWGALRPIGPSALAKASDEFKSVVLTGSLLVNSVLDSASNKVRLPGAAVLTGQKDFANLVLGLLLARYDSTLQHIQTKISTTGTPDKANFLSHALHTQAGNQNELLAAANRFGKSLANFDQALKKIREKQKKEQEKENNPAFGTTTLVLDAKAQKQQKLLSYTDFALTLTDALTQMLAVEKIFPTIPAVKIRERIIKPVQDGIQAFKHIQEKEYALAVIHTANLLIALTSRNDTTDSRSTAALKKYGSFMTSVVAAESRDQMLEALETAALPVGSYRIKRNNYFSIAINTYGGLATGSHILKEITSPTASATAVGTTKRGLLLAPYAPLGISFAWGRDADYVERRDHGSFGFHLNLLDVGALALVRLSDETASLPEFTWKNLLAPGLQVIWGIRKSVWTVSGGVQLGPELRLVQLDQNKNIIDTKQLRIGATLSADIPVFNVFTQANRRRIRTLYKSSLLIEAGRGIDENTGKPNVKPLIKPVP